MDSSTDPISVLGQDVFLLVLEYLRPVDVLAVHNVSHSWRDFLHDHDIWRRTCRREGIDVREHLHAQAERAALNSGQEYTGELGVEVTVDDYRRAYLDSVRLAASWGRRFGYETLVKMPAFKVRSIYLDHGEDYIYALTETSMSSREECLLVLNKYTGHLLQRIPGITQSANISVAAGYVSVSQHTRDSPRDRRREYSPLGTVTVFRTATAATRANAAWRNCGPLEFACQLSDEVVRQSDVMNVKLVRGQGILVTVNKATATAHLINLDQGLRNSIALGSLDTIDSSCLGDQDVTGNGKEPKVWSVNITDDHLFVVTQYQVHIYRHSGDKITAYPDPCADYLTHAGLGYAVDCYYPYNAEQTGTTLTPPKSRPPGFDVTFTLEQALIGSHPESHEFSEAIEFGFAFPSDWDDYDSDDSESQRMQRAVRIDGMNPWMQDVSFTTNDLVIRGRQGAIFVVRNYRRVLRDICDIEEAQERVAYIGRHTIVIGFCETNDVVACYGNHIAVHSAHSLIFLIDTTQLPQMPWTGDEDTTLSAITHAFEVSSLEKIQEESSLVMDARGLYLADWDRGMPGVIEYESLHEAYRNDDSWPFPIRPHWACMKAWVFRPTAALLHRPYAKTWAEAVKRHD
ncbi:hypothetical protein CspeluHIS016_0112350 [Cutaneotrichosporon spelunceum]|uniref:F-box domain-containing protein n=1 Tax=Cutaneotrichosporon spelunceum TaxID=1672016 RepID=A0AAD3TQA0_9TREE|nr:hypothetical protein CspeluHIS016_0112350 [Cutaneotrichosporon spelunceum]